LPLKLAYTCPTNSQNDTGVFRDYFLVCYLKEPSRFGFARRGNLGIY